MNLLIYGLFDNTIVLKTPLKEIKIKVGTDEAKRGVNIRCSDETALFARFYAGVWEMTLVNTGYHFKCQYSPDLTRATPREVEGLETSNRSFVAVFKMIVLVFVQNKTYRIND